MVQQPLQSQEEVKSIVEKPTFLQENKNTVPTSRDSVPPWEDIPPELEAGYVSNDSPVPTDTDITPELNVPARQVEETTNTSESIAEKTIDEPSKGGFSIEDLLLADDVVDEINPIDAELDEQESEVEDNESSEGEAGNASSVVSDNHIKTTEDYVKNNLENKEFIKPDANQPWHAVVPQLNLSGRANELIKHCLVVSHDNDIISLMLNKDSEDLLAETTKDEIQTALIKFYGENIRLDMHIAEASLDANVDKENETPAQRNDRKILETQQQAEHNIETDPFVCELQSRFGAQIVPGSVKAKQIIK